MPPQAKAARQRVKEFGEKHRIEFNESCQEAGPEFSKTYQYTYAMGNVISIGNWKPSKETAKEDAATDFERRLRGLGYRIP